jgi:zinc and cadmium transporter
MMVVAASSFVYVAVADLIPQLQKRLSGRDTVLQIVWMGAGLLMIGGIVSVLHDSHDHGDAHGAAPHAEVASSVHPDHDGHEDH